MDCVFRLISNSCAINKNKKSVDCGFRSISHNGAVPYECGLRVALHKLRVVSFAWKIKKIDPMPILMGKELSLFNKMNSISATLMPLLHSRYYTKNGHISEAEINASLKTDNWELTHPRSVSVAVKKASGTSVPPTDFRSRGLKPASPLGAEPLVRSWPAVITGGMQCRLLLLIAFIHRYSPLSSRLTAILSHAILNEWL